MRAKNHTEPISIGANSKTFDQFSANLNLTFGTDTTAELLKSVSRKEMD